MSDPLSSAARAAATSPRSQRRWSALATPVLSLLGMLVAGYLTWVHWFPASLYCAGVGDCETVNSSSYAQVAGVPVALLGFGMYAALFGLSAYRIRANTAWGLQAIFGISLAGVLYSAYLTYIELAVLRAICVWCVVSAVIITLIFGLSVREATL